TLGAGALATFRRVTLPAIRWAIAYGVVLTTARSIGEFGAVSVVSGRISGKTETLTLLVQDKYESFDVTGAYAASVLLALIAIGLTVRRRPKQEIRKRVHELLELVQLEGLGKRYPAQLSGGQRQRMALARALAVEPDVLLLDEPFGALDARVRQELRDWLRRLHDEVHVTTVFVTHDQEEAMQIADHIV